MRSYVFDIAVIDKSKINLFGGKAANLGELAKIDGLQVPEGFCISTEAFKQIIREHSTIQQLIDRLSQLRLDERDTIAKIAAELRHTIELVEIPADMKEEISSTVLTHNLTTAWAVRSSATAEDLPTASFAGQQDTYLNVIGKEALLTYIRKCWASLFTERAIIYRLQNDFDHRKVWLSVIIQKMVFPQVSGILFTADPLTSNRKVTSIDASFGLGEAVVSGLVNSDTYKVRNGVVIDKKISGKKLAIHAAKDGGTEEHLIKHEQQNATALPDAKILELEEIGRKIESYFRCPQDIEWCLVDEIFYIVQSRPITTLFPIPAIQKKGAGSSVEETDKGNRVFLSVGHQQMMTDAMKPLGLSVFQLTAGRPMFEAGGRLFVDVTDDLSSPVRQAMLIDMLGKSDPLLRDALLSIMERGDVVAALPGENQKPGPNYNALIDYDPEIVSELIRQSQASIEVLKQTIQLKSGLDLIDFIVEDIQQMNKNLSDPRSFGVFMTAMNASFWINENMKEWLNERNVADIISLSVPNNITSQMGLDLLDVADVIRPYPEVIDFLHNATEDNFLDQLVSLHGGGESRETISDFLKKYGMRCAGEIDITRTRWSEKPIKLVPVILSNIRNLPPNSARQKFDEGLKAASEKERDLLERLRYLPGGEEKVKETKRMIDLIRNFIGYREYPKYIIVNRFFVYKKALLEEARLLVHANIIHQQQDIYYLTVEELREVVRTKMLDATLVARRKAEHALHRKLKPPRVTTSEGEVITPKHKRKNLPENILVGMPVSSGVVEGRARVILKMEDADIQDGDILVTSFTDPSWTPLFVTIKGLVTEVGGLMTHGAVVAREYGLPAVVGVEDATKLVKDRQRIRVNGTDGYLEIL